MHLHIQYFSHFLGERFQVEWLLNKAVASTIQNFSGRAGAGHIRDHGDFPGLRVEFQGDVQRRLDIDGFQQTGQLPSLADWWVISANTAEYPRYSGKQLLTRVQHEIQCLIVRADNHIDILPAVPQTVSIFELREVLSGKNSARIHKKWN